MRTRFRDLSIRVKLILLMLLTAGTVLALAAGAFLTLEVRSESREIEAELSSLAGVIGFNCRAALVFGDRAAADKTLDALRLRPEIIGAWILTAAEEPFARYERSPTGKRKSASVVLPHPADLLTPGALVAAGEEAHWLEDGSLMLRRPVILDDQLVGILVLQADLVKLRARMTTLTSALGAVLLFSCLFALLLASWLQRFISRPIVEVTGLMGEVSQVKNYGLRLVRQSDDEVGQLVSGFNDMLEQIEIRDRRLEEANLSLEQRVAARTEALSQANAELARLLEEYRQAETSLRQSEEKYRSLFENAPVSFWEQDFSGVLEHLAVLRSEGVEDFAAYFSEHPGELNRCAALARILDVNHKTLKLFAAADKQAFFDGLGEIFTERSFAALRDILVALAKGEQTFETEGVNRTLAGEERHFLVRYSTLPVAEDADGRLLVSLLDITERKRAEEALRQGESRFRSLFENSPVSLWEEDCSAVKLYLDHLRRSGVEDFSAYFSLRPDAVRECARLIRILDVNQATVRMFGAVDKTKLLGHLDRVFTEETYVLFREELEAMAQGETRIELEGVVRTLDGETRFVNMRLSVVPGQEETWSEVIVSLVDLTGRRATEEALRQSEARFRQMVDLLPQTIFEADAGGRLTFANRAGLQAFGYAPEDLAAGLRVVDVIAPAERQEALPNLLRVLQGEVVGPVERTLICKDGRTFPALIHAGPILRGFEPVGMRGLIIDISERRHAEEALRMLGKALETTRMGVTIANMQGEIIYTNPAEASMHGYTIDELLGQSANIFGPAERRSVYPLAYLQTSQRESVNMRKDGSLFPVRLVSDLVTDAAGDPLAVVTVCEDITERKEAEARLKASLAEKEVLLKEVHHRVKNNMQIISSLLNLQLKKITDARTRAELHATRSRIRSMGLIHARLYQSQDLTRINFAEYIEEFSRQLSSLYDLDPTRIRMTLDIDTVFLEVDVAIPCGMIVNELLTNALKYAFPGERAGEIRVRLLETEGQMVLSVVDDGIGISTDIDLDSVETLGLQLVRGLAQQIGGTVTIEGSGGTRVQICIPLPDNADPEGGGGTNAKQSFPA